MSNNKSSKRKNRYRVDIYNKYVDIAFAHADLDEFKIEELLSHKNTRVREFSFILISKRIQKDDYVIDKPIIAIYDKNIWKHRFYFTKDRFDFKFTLHTRYSCTHHFEEIDNNILINVPCNNQEQMLNRFNSISKLLVDKGVQKEDTLLEQ